MVVTQRNPPTNSRKNRAQARPIKNVKNSLVKPKDTFDCKTEDISPGDFVDGKYVESSQSSSPIKNYPSQNQQTTKKTKTNSSPIRPSLHTNSTPLVNNMAPFTNLYYNTPPVHYRNYSTPTMYPVTAPPTIPIPTSLAKPIPFPIIEEKALLVPGKLANKSSPSIPVPISAYPNTQKATKPGYFSVDELEQNNTSPKRPENELSTSPGTSPISSSAPKRLQNAVVKPANSRYYSDGNYANAPHPSDLPRPQFS